MKKRIKINKGGRPPIDQELKKVPRSIRLPQWLINWMDDQEENRAQLIEDALCWIHELKPPKRGRN